MRTQYLTPFNPETLQTTGLSTKLGVDTRDQAREVMRGMVGKAPDKETHTSLIYYLTKTSALAVSWVRFSQ